ncbi:hypothetical protein BSL78_29199 [Apostichopus japonicus]|uniref:Endonuclease/exonuclease/phosphatase domain-containing protein n=1 Tax=Stichopus japonicus TaxID=307972 RepID=A0A2G8JE26_STIJA|nr:hypothetical protein BSL78_29199 [Apostichopus japonicus]
MYPPSRRSYMYFFKFNERSYCVDATTSTGNGRLVNDAPKNTSKCNCRANVVEINGQPYCVCSAQGQFQQGKSSVTTTGLATYHGATSLFFGSIEDTTVSHGDNLLTYPVLAFKFSCGVICGAARVATQLAVSSRIPCFIVLLSLFYPPNAVNMCSKWMFIVLLVVFVTVCIVSHGNGEVFHNRHRTVFYYTPSELRAIGTRCAVGTGLPDMRLPKEMRRRKRGKAGGVKRRNSQCKNRPYLPSIIMGNVQSLSNKMDELCASVRYLSDFRNTCIVSFTETWLTGNHSDDHVNIDGFQLVRGDRDLEAAGKCSGGGVCVYVNQKWCHPNNVYRKDYVCTPHLEMLTVSVRPFYLPREFSHVLVCSVYIPDKSVAKAGSAELIKAIQDLEAKAPDALIVVNGDFNHGSMKHPGLRFYQHVNCPTRGESTLDLCYTNVKDAYVSSQLTKLGEADHDLFSCYQSTGLSSSVKSRGNYNQTMVG